MVTAGSNHGVKVWDMKRRICMQTLSGHASTVTCVAINAKDEQLASVSEKGTLCLHNLNSGTRVAQLRDPDGQVSELLVVSSPFAIIAKAAALRRSA
jgi:WD40 repeat protein